jgi:hypothetical protein
MGLPERLQHLQPAVDAFGPLPEPAQLELAEAINAAMLTAVASTKFTFPAGVHARRLAEIARAAGRLHKLLNEDDLPTGVGPLLLRLSKRHIALPLLVSDLRKLATLAQRMSKLEEAGKKSGRGGRTREGPGPQEVLLRGLFDIYSNIRARYPKSGHEIGFGGPLLRFVQVVWAVWNTEPLKDGVVKGAFNRWRMSTNQS